ncbi:MAG: hypothetical protein L0L95_10775, partial [Staphylococcus equorum]|nr:hypothetical protein [Staphylococcus equorum]
FFIVTFAGADGEILLQKLDFCLAPIFYLKDIPLITKLNLILKTHQSKNINLPILKKEACTT